MIVWRRPGISPSRLALIVSIPLVLILASWYVILAPARQGHPTTGSNTLSSSSSITSTSSKASTSSTTTTSSSTLTQSSSSSTTGSPPGCTRYDPLVADPPAPHGLFVNAANSPAALADEQEILQYTLTDSTVCGANLIVPWSSVDAGPANTPRYNWTFVQDSMKPWTSAGRIVNLIVWGVAEQNSQQYGQPVTPSYVLGQVQTVQCGNDPPAPVYWQSGYLDNYEAFIKAVLAEYGNSPSVGYIRFGFGVGGEDYPQNGFDQSPCLSSWQSAGYSYGGWQNYTLQLMAYEKSLDSPKQILVGLNQIQGQNSVADAVAAQATADDFGFGVQGFSIGAKQANDSGQECYANWCSLFKEYAGQVPLELQTTTHTYPDGSGVGSLVDLAPFGIRARAQVFELYPNEWLVANDPAYPGYSQYHTAYKDALISMANVVGYSSAGAVPPASPSVSYTVQGSEIIDSDGNVLIPYGVEIPGLWISDWQSNAGMLQNARQLQNATMYADARFFWHSNTLDIKVASADLFDQSPYDKAYLKTVDTAVNYSRAYGMNIVIALQYESTTKQPLPTQDSMAFWSFMATHYKQDPWVFFDIFNEPRSPSGADNSGTWNLWENGGTYNGTTFVGLQQLVDAIRMKGSANLIFADGLASGEDLNEVPMHLLAGGNVAYAIHPYFGPQHLNETDWNYWFGDVAKSGNVPVVADEWGEYQSSTHGECVTNAPNLVPQFLAYLDGLKIGVIGYGLYPGILIRGENFTNPTAFDQPGYSCPNAPFPNPNPDAQGAGSLLAQYFAEYDSYAAIDWWS